MMNYAAPLIKNQPLVGLFFQKNTIRHSLDPKTGLESVFICSNNNKFQVFSFVSRADITQSVQMK